MYQSCNEYVLRLASFYLCVDNCHVDKLKQFSSFTTKEPDLKLFVFSVGGDSVPINGTMFLVSFINCGVRLVSSAENFMVFGANVDENSKVVCQFVLKLLLDIRFLESKAFSVEVGGIFYSMKFKLGELHNDMKMLAFLAGECSILLFHFCKCESKQFK